MKKILFTLSFLACALLAIASSSVGGTWKVDTDAAGNTSTSILALTQDGKKLTGTIKGPDGHSFDIAGSIDGSKIEWVYKKDWQGNILTVTYTGTIDDAGKITGSTDVQPMGIEGAFVAKRAEKK